MIKQAKKTNWLKTTILVILACGIVGLALTAILFFAKPSPTYATATLVFTFDGAATGTAPNGTVLSRRKFHRSLLDAVPKAEHCTVFLLQVGSP